MLFLDLQFVSHFLNPVSDWEIFYWTFANFMTLLTDTKKLKA